jgi:hypothetical protein
MSYCVSEEGKYYKVEEKEEMYNHIRVGCRVGYMRPYKALTECELILMTVDVIARNPKRSKEYDRYYVYELKPLKNHKPIKISNNSFIFYNKCNEYVYEKIL